MLTRIDGHTPWALLREIGGLLPEEADLALESWVQTGLVMLDEKPAPPPAVAAESEPAADAAAGGIDAAEIDESLEIDVELQRRILELDASLEHASYHEILGVERGSETRQIKRAYFQLSKQFHPDRYFRREVGGYAKKLDRIFKYVALAYELLSDPASRAEIEREMPKSRPAADAGAYRRTGAGAPDEGPKGYRAPTRMENLERLRGRFKMPPKVLAERRFKARQFYQAARAAAHMKNWLEAGASARLAIAFDPTNREFKEGFAEIQAEVHAARASALLEQADDAGAHGDALKLLEEAIHYRPADAALQARAAGLALEMQQVDTAAEYAESACELEPEVAAHQLLRCRVLRRQGEKKAAHEALCVAEKLAPRDPEVIAERQRLPRRR